MDRHGRPRVSVVIPTLNEAPNIGWVLERIPDEVGEVILVDGRSSDGTIDAALAVRPDARVMHEPRPGKGVALRLGFGVATGDMVVMLDADGSMHPREIPRFVARIEEGFDLVKGSRFTREGGTVDISRVRAVGNLGLLAVTNRLYGCRFTELCYGFMALRRSVIPRLALTADGFEIEAQIVASALRADLRVCEVPSFESARRSGVSHLRVARDGTRVLREVVRARGRRARPPQGPDVPTPDWPPSRPELALDARAEAQA
jgi:glycosyltransferase involved in cell wall biosynthesis